jgi:hypothetical protein
MKISEALNAAADHIERFPEKYNFMCLSTPFGGEQACMLGRFAQVAGLGGAISVDSVAYAVLGRHPQHFYNEIASAAGASPADNDEQQAILNDVTKIPNAMRQVARKYEGIPQSVLELFNNAGAAPYIRVWTNRVRVRVEVPS